MIWYILWGIEKIKKKTMKIIEIKKNGWLDKNS